MALNIFHLHFIILFISRTVTYIFIFVSISDQLLIVPILLTNDATQYWTKTLKHTFLFHLMCLHELFFFILFNLIWINRSLCSTHNSVISTFASQASLSDFVVRLDELEALGKKYGGREEREVRRERTPHTDRQRERDIHTHTHTHTHTHIERES